METRFASNSLLATVCTVASNSNTTDCFSAHTQLDDVF